MQFGIFTHRKKWTWNSHILHLRHLPCKAQLVKGPSPIFHFREVGSYTTQREGTFMFISGTEDLFPKLRASNLLGMLSSKSET